MTASDFLELRNYLKSSLSLDIRNDLEGNEILCLLLEDEVISVIPFIIEEVEDESSS